MDRKEISRTIVDAALAGAARAVTDLDELIIPMDDATVLYSAAFNMGRLLSAALGVTIGLRDLSTMTSAEALSIADTVWLVLLTQKQLAGDLTETDALMLNRGGAPDLIRSAAQESGRAGGPRSPAEAAATLMECLQKLKPAETH